VKPRSGEVHVRPLEGHDLPAPQPGLTSEKHDEVRSLIRSLGGLHEPLVLLEVVELRFGWRDGKELDGAWHRLDNTPFHRDLHELAEHREDVVDGLGRLA
jgi:hypothetical protein